MVILPLPKVASVSCFLLCDEIYFSIIRRLAWNGAIPNMGKKDNRHKINRTSPVWDWRGFEIFVLLKSASQLKINSDSLTVDFFNQFNHG